MARAMTRRIGRQMAWAAVSFATGALVAYGWTSNRSPPAQAGASHGATAPVGGALGGETSDAPPCAPSDSESSDARAQPPEELGDLYEYPRRPWPDPSEPARAEAAIWDVEATRAGTGGAVLRNVDCEEPPCILVFMHEIEAFDGVRSEFTEAGRPLGYSIAWEDPDGWAYAVYIDDTTVPANSRGEQEARLTAVWETVGALPPDVDDALWMEAEHLAREMQSDGDDSR